MIQRDRFSIEPPAFDPELEVLFEAWLARSGRSLEDVAESGIEEEEAGELGARAGEAHVLAAWRALAAAPDDGLRILDLASAYVDSLDDLETAERIFEECDRLGCPGLVAGVLDEDPLFYLGWLYYLAGRDEEAIEAYRQALDRLDDREPGLERDTEGHALASFHLGAVYHELGRYREAAQSYQTALADLAEDPAGRAVVEHELANARAGRPFESEIGPSIAEEPLATEEP